MRIEESSQSNLKSLVFTFYAKGPLKSPDYYYITVTSPNDVFFVFNSEKITPSKFLDITNHLNVKIPTAQKDVLKNHANAKRERQNALGYHPQDGAGGVVGVIAGDCLNGVQQEPHR